MTGVDERGGPLVAIGGAEDTMRSQRILRRVVELAGADRGHMCVVPTASGLPDTGQRYRQVFEDLGMGSVAVLPFQLRADGADPATLTSLRKATGIFFAGGNQLRLSTILGGSEAVRVIRQRNREGAVVAGTSAGAAVLFEHMIAFGEEGPTPRAGMVSLVPGFGLCDSLIIDQHFRQRDRLGRLLTALAYNPQEIGIGLDEDTAALVDAQERVHVLGSGAVTVVDASQLEHSGMGYVRRGQPVPLTGLRLHVLVEGGVFSILERTAHPAQTTKSDVPAAQLAAADNDVDGKNDADGKDRWRSPEPGVDDPGGTYADPRTRRL